MINLVKYPIKFYIIVRIPMTESFKYKDKSIDTIKKDVETEFKSADKR